MIENKPDNKSQFDVHPPLAQEARRQVKHHQSGKNSDIHGWRSDNPPQAALHDDELLMQHRILRCRLLFGFRMVDK